MMNNETRNMNTAGTEAAAVPAEETPKKLRSIKNNPVNIAKTVFVYFFLVLFLLWILVPFYIILVTSFKTEAEVNEKIGRAHV